MVGWLRSAWEGFRNLRKPLDPQEDYDFEVQKISTDRSKFARAVYTAKDKIEREYSGLKQEVEWQKLRVLFLRDESFHPVVRLTIANKMYRDMIDGYIEKLEKAATGDERAIAAVKEAKDGLTTILPDQISRIEAKIAVSEATLKQKKESITVETAKWIELKERADTELEEARSHRNELIKTLPEEQTAESAKTHSVQWKAYYLARIQYLEKPTGALTQPARLVWTSYPKGQRLIDSYLSLLNKLIAGEEVEEEFHAIENRMDIIIVKDALRVRREHPEFF